MSGNAIFAIVAGVIAVGLIVWVVIIVRRARQVAGDSDERLNARLYAALNNLPPDEASIPKRLPPKPGVVVAPSSAPTASAPSASKESRLAELADLHSRGLINDDELAAARLKILAE